MAHDAPDSGAVMSPWSAALAGAAAGFGVAVPMGAIAVLLLQEGLRSWRRAAAAAVAVATVDGAYAAAAVSLGPLIVSALRGVEAWVRLVSAIVLAAIAIRGLCTMRRPATDATDARPSEGPVWRVYARFVALTAINPTTALYFTALTTAQGATLNATTTAAVFALAAFVASLLWQQLLAAAGAFAGTRLPAPAWPVTYAVGYGLVLIYAAILAWPPPSTFGTQ